MILLIPTDLSSLTPSPGSITNGLQGVSKWPQQSQEQPQGHKNTTCRDKLGSRGRLSQVKKTAMESSIESSVLSYSTWGQIYFRIEQEGQDKINLFSDTVHSLLWILWLTLYRCVCGCLCAGEIFSGLYDILVFQVDLVETWVKFSKHAISNILPVPPWLSCLGMHIKQKLTAYLWSICLED